MFKHGFPPEWSTFKKLIWLVGSGIAGAASGIWKTVTGTLIHITDALASPMQKCEVSLEPIQDLHGQDAPYPAGGGKNKFDKDVLDSPSDYSNNYNGYMYSNPIFLKPNTTYTISPTSTDKLGVSDYYVLYINRNETDPNAIENPTGSVSFLYPVSAGKPTVITFTTGATGAIRFGVITASTQQVKETALAAFMTIDYQVEEGSTATPWTPYSNICPITGWTGCEVTRTGKELFANDTSKLEEITYLSSGNPVTRWGYVIVLPAGTYRISAWNKTAETASIYFYGGRFKKGTSPYERVTTQNLIAGTAIIPQTITLADDEVIIYYNGTGNTTKEQVAATLSKFNIQLEVGSTTTDFEEYQGITLSVTFPDTVYGGKYEFVSGGLKNKKVSFNAKDVSWNDAGLGRVYTLLSLSPTELTTPLCSHCEYHRRPASGAYDNWIDWGGYPNSNKNLIVTLKGITDTLSQWNTYIQNNDVQFVYELETPTEIQLTPQEISTLKGENNVWSNSNGDTTIIYKAQAE